MTPTIGSVFFTENDVPPAETACAESSVVAAEMSGALSTSAPERRAIS